MSLKDVLGPKATRDAIDNLQSVWQTLQIIGYKEMRPWPEFFAVFKVPQLNVRHIEQRATTNLLHYRSNYMMICSALFGLNCLWKPVLFFATLTIIWIWIAAFVVTKNTVRVGEIVIRKSHKLFISLILTVLVLLITGTLEQLLWFCLYSIVLTGVHVMFRPRSVGSKAGKMYDEMKVNGFNWFGPVDLSSGSESSNFAHSAQQYDPENPLQKSD